MNTQTYKWNAVDYAKSSSIQQQWARELIQKLELRGTERILDIGCGDGKVTAELASHVPQGFVVGIDSSKDMVSLAQRTFSRDGFPNLQFQLENASSLKFKNKFDIIFSNATLHWMIDHRPVLQGIYQSLKKGGNILLQMGGKGNAEEVFEAFESLREKDKWREYFDGFQSPYGFYGDKEYQIWLLEAGLQPIRVELIPKDAVPQDRNAFEAWIRTTWLLHIQQVPEQQRNNFISELAQQYLQCHPVDTNGSVHVKMVRLEVEATKS